MTALVTASIGVDDAPSESAPGWLRLMMLLASRLPTVEIADGIAARAVVAAPTTRHVSAAMAVSGVRSTMEQPGVALGPEQKVATVLSKRFCDADVVSFGARLSLDGVQFDPQRVPPAALLDETWQMERSPQSVPPQAVEASRALGRKGYPAEWTYLRFCLSPIVVLAQRPAQVAEDLMELAQVTEWWNPFQRLGLASPSDGADMWFRRPIVMVSPAGLAGAPWLARLPVSLMVVVGFSAWIAPQRNFWPAVPQVLMLNQRTSDIADFRAWFDGAVLPEVHLPGARSRDLRKSGITMATFGEPVESAPTEGGDLQEADEWAF